MFVKVDDSVYVRRSLSPRLMSNCLAFVERQMGVEKGILENACRRGISHSLLLPKDVHYEDVDIAIKTNFNNDYKFINITKSVLFYQSSSSSSSIMDVIDRFDLSDIYFFPGTYVSGELIYQQLAAGGFYRPETLDDFRSYFLRNLVEVVDVLSCREECEIRISDYLRDCNVISTADHLNIDIIKIFYSVLQKSKQQYFFMSLSHGDLKFEHIATLDGRLEYVIDWENVGVRSMFFDLLNYFVPWFQYRSYGYLQIKEYIFQFIQSYIPGLFHRLSDNYDIYFSLFVLERYIRIRQARSDDFDLDAAYKRYNLLFLNMAKELSDEL